MVALSGANHADNSSSFNVSDASQYVPSSAADLPHCSAHGVRKATSTALAEAGATPHEIMAVTGHQTLEEVERYTKAASRKKKRIGLWLS